MSNDPRGKTLWEMLVDWMRGDAEPRAKAEPPPARERLPPMPNPLGLEVGSQFQVRAENGTAFAHPVIVRGLRQVVRRIAGRSFSFVDYIVQPPGFEEVRLRCVPDSAGESRLLLECVDGFPAEEEFLEVVNDDTGTFDITDDDTGKSDQFQRMNGVHGPYEAMVRSARGIGSMDYWDWVRTAEDGSEEFVFVEHLKEDDQIEIWRGWRLKE